MRDKGKKHKKYMIRCDMEGVSGVVNYEQVEPGRNEYSFGRSQLAFDLSNVLAGLERGGAGEIHIYDEHFFGRNVDQASLPDNVLVYCGKPQYTASWAGGLDRSFQGLILVGLHSKAGTANGLLNHSYEDAIEDILINGMSVGEIGVEAAIAGEFDVPLILVTGDSAGIEEAQALVPNVIGVPVKKSLGANSAICYSRNMIARLIGDGVRRAIARRGDIAPFKCKHPVSMTIRLREGKFRDRMKERYSALMDDNGVIIVRDSLLEAYANYWEMKLSCT